MHRRRPLPTLIATLALVFAGASCATTAVRPPPIAEPGPPFAEMTVRVGSPEISDDLVARRASVLQRCEPQIAGLQPACWVRRGRRDAAGEFLGDVLVALLVAPINAASHSGQISLPPHASPDPPGLVCSRAHPAWAQLDIAVTRAVRATSDRTLVETLDQLETLCGLQDQGVRAQGTPVEGQSVSGGSTLGG